jgi:hypothetical protein
MGRHKVPQSMCKVSRVFEEALLMCVKCLPYAKNFSIVCTNMLTISYILVSNNVYSVRNERSRTYPLRADHFPPRMDFNNS